jgi:ABC-type transport system involved in cytochrome c biogenesis ATPase subunit
VATLRAAGRPGQPPGPARASAVECTDLTFRFGEHVAVNKVSLRIAAGEIFGLLGPNGAGKTTTLRMLITLLRPDAGRAAVFGTDVAAQPMRVRRLIGYVPQLLSADASLTGHENVELFARLVDVPRAMRRPRVDGALTAMGLTDAAGRLVKTYSGGMIRRLELAQALVSTRYWPATRPAGTGAGGHWSRRALEPAGTGARGHAGVRGGGLWGSRLRLPCTGPRRTAGTASGWPPVPGRSRPAPWPPVRATSTAPARTARPGPRRARGSARQKPGWP